MTNVQFPMTNGGGRAARAGHPHQKMREAPPSLVIGHWSLVISRIVREDVRE
jgi:hypothetical protein